MVPGNLLPRTHQSRPTPTCLSPPVLWDNGPQAIDRENGCVVNGYPRSLRAASSGSKKPKPRPQRHPSKQGDSSCLPETQPPLHSFRIFLVSKIQNVIHSTELA